MKIKDFFKKVKAFSLLDYLLNRRIGCLYFKMGLKKDLIIFFQGKLTEADEMKTNAGRSISKLADEIKELKEKIKDIKKVG